MEYVVAAAGVVVAVLGLLRAAVELRRVGVEVRAASRSSTAAIAELSTRLDWLDRRVVELGRSVGGIRDDRRQDMAALNARQNHLEERITQWLT